MISFIFYSSPLANTLCARREKCSGSHKKTEVLLSYPFRSWGYRADFRSWPGRKPGGCRKLRRLDCRTPLPAAAPAARGTSQGMLRGSEDAVPPTRANGAVPGSRRSPSTTQPRAREGTSEGSEPPGAEPSSSVKRSQLGGCALPFLRVPQRAEPRGLRCRRCPLHLSPARVCACTPRLPLFRSVGRSSDIHSSFPQIPLSLF